ncbi:MAG TPA: glycosyltransferase family 1 protein [Candidatus Bipolaricaulota bacterium]|nr:glycosyltransferase family 1 protein [Candidatus Bipolaricaulota bacterium]
MRIGIDCRKIFDPIKNTGAGVERYTFNLVKNLIELDEENDYVLFIPAAYSKNALDILIKDGGRAQVRKIRSGKMPFWSRHLKFSFQLYRAKLDLALFPANIIPIGYAKRSFVFVHDLIIYKHPEWFPTGQFFSKKVLVPLSLKKAEKIIAISQATKKDLIQLFRAQGKKIEVVYPSVDIYPEIDPRAEEKAKQKFNLEKRYLFFVGTLEPRKNLVNLIKAFKKVLREFPDVDLYLAGNVGWHYEKIIGAAASARGKSNIKFLGAVTNLEKLVLMKNCSVFVFLSWDEGFGMPVLEAMKVGVPIVTSAAGGLGELISDNRQIAAPGDINDIAQKIKNLLADQELRRNIIEKQKKWSENFSWRYSAQKLLKIIQGK